MGTDVLGFGGIALIILVIWAIMALGNTVKTSVEGFAQNSGAVLSNAAIVANNMSKVGVQKTESMLIENDQKNTRNNKARDEKYGLTEEDRKKYSNKVMMKKYGL